MAVVDYPVLVTNGSSRLPCIGAGFAAGMESLEKVWILFLRIPDLDIVWKLMKSFGKRWRVLENSFFEKDVFFFFEPARDRGDRDVDHG